jgi:serine O-acetyltransferase
MDMQQRIDFRTYRQLVMSDLYRIGARTAFRHLIYEVIFGESFRYVFWMRTCRYTRGLRVLKYALHPIARLFLRHHRYKLGISIPYDTDIGKGFYIGHFGGIVVNDETRIGNNCNISHGVTIGRGNRGPRRGCPAIGNNVFIGPGAKLFGSINIGNNVAIGANCVVTNDVPDNAVVAGVPGKVISLNGSYEYVRRTDYEKCEKKTDPLDIKRLNDKPPLDGFSQRISKSNCRGTESRLVQHPSLNQKIASMLLVRKELCVLTFPGKLLGILLLFVVAMLGVRGMFPLLAVSCPTRTGIMVVEGWIHTMSIPQVVQEYAASQYEAVVVVNAIYDTGDKWTSGRYEADYLTNSFIRLGIPSSRMHLVTCDVVQKDRTYHSALAVKEWLRRNGASVKTVDVVTIGSHARRSRLLFENAFEGKVDIGVIALDEKKYDPGHWWRSSEGVREVLFEGVAYLYVRFFFRTT